MYIKIKINPISYMKLKNKMKLLFKSIFTQFGSVISAEGQQIIWDGDGDIAEGYEVYMEQENENGELEYVPVPDGEYKIEEKVIVVAEGKVSEIRVEEKSEPAEPENPAQEMEETPAAPAEPEAPAEPTTEEIVTDPEEPFDAQKAYNDLKIDFEALKQEFETLKGQLAKLLEVPAEEDAFSAAKKNETVEEKKFVCKANIK